MLGRLDTPVATSALVDAAIQDNDEEVRLRCIEQLKQRDTAAPVQSFARALRSSSNRQINRAAVALGRLGDAEAVLPLINALITRHEAVLPAQPTIQPSFSSGADGNSGFGMSIGGAPRKVARSAENKSVLEALVALTQQNFQYSESDWKDWYIQQHALPDDVNLRRDP
jgi:hypothetical protein